MNAQQQPAAPELPEHMQRVAAEKSELDCIIKGLKSFIASRTFQKLPQNEQELMRRQLDTVGTYSAAFGRIIKNAQTEAAGRSARRCAGDGQP